MTLYDDVRKSEHQVRLRLRTLAHEAYQPRMFEKALSQVEADRRIAAIKTEIELANSF